jgi:hypothetical protein
MSADPSDPAHSRWLKRIESLALIVFVVVLCSTGGVITITRLIRGPQPTGWLTLSLCRLPCWRGISPGITTFEQAKRLVLRMPDAQSVQFINAKFPPTIGRFELGQGEGQQVNVSFRTDDPDIYPVDSLIFDQIGLYTRLEDLMNQLGPPTRAHVMRGDNGTALLTFNFKNQNLIAMANIWPANLTQLCAAGFQAVLIDTIIIHDPDNQFWPGTPWQGDKTLNEALCDASSVAR